jgi:hypothetical protein
LNSPIVADSKSPIFEVNNYQFGICNGYDLLRGLSDDPEKKRRKKKKNKKRRDNKKVKKQFDELTQMMQTMSIDCKCNSNQNEGRRKKRKPDSKKM